MEFFEHFLLPIILNMSNILECRFKNILIFLVIFLDYIFSFFIYVCYFFQKIL